MLQWIKKHKSILITVLVCIGFLLYCYGCEPRVRSITDNTKTVNRQELQLELDTFISMAKIRMADLEKQEALRTMVLQNALILAQGQPVNPIGIISAFAAIYGIAQGSTNITKVVKNKVKNRKANNGTG